MITALALPPGARAALRAHADRESPRECCGILIGRIVSDRVQVEQVIPGVNLAPSHDLYLLDPEDFVRADTVASALGFTVVGFYHSHPRGPARLSRTDLAGAWPEYVYLLIFPPIGLQSGFSAWIPSTDGASFIPVTLEG